MPTLDWYLNRLRSMSAAEVAHRARTTAADLLERSLARRSRRAPPAQPEDGFRWTGSQLPPSALAMAAAYASAADDVIGGRIAVFDIADAGLGTTPNWNRDPRTGIVAPLVYGKTLDYRDERLVGDIKCVWEINRHLQWVTLAQAWALTGSQRYLIGLRDQLDSWLLQCPSPLGVNWCSALESAIRLLNWAWVWSLIGGRAAKIFENPRGEALLARWMASIYQHQRFIDRSYSAHSSANNHLIGEAVGAFVASSVWPCWHESGRWRRRAHAIVQREALLQNSADGVNREQALGYQQFVLDFLVTAGIVGERSGTPYSDEFWRRLAAMAAFICAVTDSGGHVPMIGDADDGYVYRLIPFGSTDNFASLRNTVARLTGMDRVRASSSNDAKTDWYLAAMALGPDRSSLDATRSAQSAAFDAGGYFVLASTDTAGREIKCVADAGPLGYLGIAAHGHADALSLVLSYDGLEFLIDPGTFSYHTQPAWRAYFRGTAAHNTVRVDGQDQSVSGGNFLWLRHAQTSVLRWTSDASADELSACHDGYTRLADPVVHRRDVRLDKARYAISVVDTLECRGPHLFEWHWHFAEMCSTALHNGVIEAIIGERRVRLEFDDRAIEAKLVRGREDPPLGWISRRFNVRAPSDTWVLTRRGSGNFVARFVFSFL